jgi:hypothetical protein
MNQEIAELLAPLPFVQFVVVMNSGDRYTVVAPRLTVFTGSLLYIMRPHSDRQDILRLTEISALELLEHD